MMKTQNTLNQRVVIITSERAAMDNSLTYMIGFAVSISTAIDIVMMCNDRSINQYMEGEPDITSAVDSIMETGKRYSLDLAVELCSTSNIFRLKDNLSKKKGLSMILLGPSVNNNKVLDLRKILKEIPVPVLAISKPGSSLKHNKAARKKATQAYYLVR
ncbi:hypothetical protein [Candidatus Magnetomonas plexicatena]|uniref:hypothetical protein n=1 Tax=Candidatus Magnetomonas plexicatena TaxID=2552947 RepID=UPI001100228C|nr:hypothetical protein E2O03_005515 [Nitrospirales bacterium LBB_01]